MLKGKIYRSASSTGPCTVARGRRRLTSPGLLRALAFDGPEQVGDDVVLGAAGRRRAADEVEDLAVFHAVFGEPLHFSVLVEIDHDHALVGDRGVDEGDRALSLLRDVIERLAADGCHR